MNSPAPPSIMFPKDKIGRTILNERDWRMVKRHNAPARIFRDNLSPVRISVHRLDIAPDKTLALIGHRQAKDREGKREFHGWAELTVADAERDERRKVCPSPLQNNMWHADIVLPDEVNENRAELQRHAEELAAKVKPRPRPEK